MTKFLNYIYNRKNLDDLIDKSNLDIHILFYLATQHSIKTIEDNISSWGKKHNISFNHSVQAIQILDDIIAIETKILADSKADKCYFARLIDFPIERLPIVPHEFLNCIGWTLIFNRKLNIH